MSDDYTDIEARLRHWGPTTATAAADAIAALRKERDEAEQQLEKAETVIKGIVDGAPAVKELIIEEIGALEARAEAAEAALADARAALKDVDAWLSGFAVGQQRLALQVEAALDRTAQQESDNV